EPAAPGSLNCLSTAFFCTSHIFLRTTTARGGFWRQVVPKHSFELAHVVTSVSGSTARVNDCGGDAIWLQQAGNLPLVYRMAFVIGPFAVTIGAEKLLDLPRCQQASVLAEETAEGCEQTFALARLIALTRKLSRGSTCFRGPITAGEIGNGKQ